MSGNNVIPNEVRKTLADPAAVERNRFAILQDLCRLASTLDDGTEIQDLVLRALEYRQTFAESRPVLDALVRRLGLFPYLDPDLLSGADQIAYELHRPLNMGERLVFHRPQAAVYRMLLDGESVALSAPTSFGKSLIIDAIIASGRFRNIVIVVPTIALIDETRRRLSERFRRHFRIITHSFQKRGPRNIFVLTQERVLELDDIENIDFFVIDEFYKLTPGRDDDERCALLNQAFYRLAKTRRQFYMLGPGIEGLSAEISQRLACRFVRERYETVVSELHEVSPGRDPFSTLVDVCKGLSDPTMVFCSSPARASDVARRLTGAVPASKSAELRRATEWVSTHYHPQWHFAQALEHGIGVHHGRIPRALAQYVVRQFNQGAMRFLVCTSTLIEGVNTKAKNIVVFDHTIARSPIDLFTFNNIRGRSGRMFEHFIGHVYIFHSPPQTELPFVGVPVYEQTEAAPESLLIQVDDEDLTPTSKRRLTRYAEQDVLAYATLKKERRY